VDLMMNTAVKANIDVRTTAIKCGIPVAVALVVSLIAFSFPKESSDIVLMIVGGLAYFVKAIVSAVDYAGAWLDQLVNITSLLNYIVEYPSVVAVVTCISLWLTCINVKMIQGGVHTGFVLKTNAVIFALTILLIMQMGQSPNKTDFAALFFLTSLVVLCVGNGYVYCTHLERRLESKKVPDITNP
jgi:hypothetical protein